MKKNLLLAGIIGLLLVLGTVIAGCDQINGLVNKEGDGEEEPPPSVTPDAHKDLIGKWCDPEDKDDPSKQKFEVTSAAILIDGDGESCQMFFPDEGQFISYYKETEYVTSTFCAYYEYDKDTGVLTLFGGDESCSYAKQAGSAYKKITSP
jgi:hypothetical protein